MRAFERPSSSSTPAPARTRVDRRLRVAPVHSAAEAAADRAADAAMRFDGAGRTPIPTRIGDALGVQRQTPGDAERKANEAKGEDELAKMAKAVLADAATREPLKSVIADGQKALATPAGKAAIAEVILGVITASVLAKRPLPITSFTLDLGDVATSLKGATATLKWEGPANSPTKAGVEIGYSPPAGPLQGASVSLGGETTAKGPMTFGPNGPATGPSIGIFDPLAQRQAAANVGVGYKLQSGVLKGSEIKATATASTGGAYGGGLSLTIPLGSTPKKKKHDAERPDKMDTLQRSPEAAAPARAAAARTAGPGTGSTEHDTAPDSVTATLDRPGASLPDPVRTTMQDRLGADFSRVRVHADPAAQASARDVGAAAYTVGNHVVFGAERWSPQTAGGQRLLAHELAHVVQQGGSEP